MPTLVIHEGAGAGSEHLVDGELTLGREEGSADLVIDDLGVSRQHARFLADGGAIRVEDLGSANGTYVNGERISRAVPLAAGDEVQVGATVLGVEGGHAATALIPPGADTIAEHPGPPRRPPAPAQPRPVARPAPRRLGPHPQEQPNIPALSAVFLGPLSIVLLVFSSGAAFFVSLPCAIAAVVLGTIGIRNVDRGKADGFRGLARIGRITGITGTILSVLALIAFVVVATALDTTERSLSGLIDRVQEEIEGVEVPDVDAPDVDSPDVNGPDAPDAPNLEEPGGDSGGAEPPDQGQ
jgi:pSer/pThr/pTyr-binding forkhead associated (FHA) protein